MLLRISIIAAMAGAPLGCHAIVDPQDYELAPPRCSRYTPTVIASGQQSPRDIWAGSDNVYWIDGPVDGALGRIMRFDRSTRELTTLVEGLSNPVGLRAIDTEIVFTNDVGGSDEGSAGVFRVPKAGGTATRVGQPDGLGFGRLSVRDEEPGDGEDPEALYHLALSEAWSADEVRVRRSELGASPGGGCEFLYESGAPGRITATATPAGGLHFADTSVGAILRVGYDCGSVTTVFSANQPDVRRMVASGSKLFWVTEDSAFQQSLEGGGAEVVPGGPDDLAGIALLPPNHELVVTSRGSGTVLKVGDAPEVLACDQGGPNQITDTDDGHVLFWTNTDSGEVMQLDLPNGL